MVSLDKGFYVLTYYTLNYYNPIPALFRLLTVLATKQVSFEGVKSSFSHNWHHLSLRGTLSIPPTKHLIVIKGKITFSSWYKNLLWESLN